MSLTDLPMAVMFLIFLMLFVLVGIYPAWKRTARKIRAFLKSRRVPGGPTGGLAEGERAPPRDFPEVARALSEYDRFILQLLARAGGKGLSRRQILADLHFEPAVVGRSLASLRDRELVTMARPLGLSFRYILSPAGRDLAIAQGYLPRILVN